MNTNKENKMDKISNQHGDLILKIVTEIPKSAKKIDNLGGKFIVERGEGVHVHEVDTEGVEVYQDGDILYLKTNKKVTLTHEEHGAQILEPNKIYRKVIEREWDYESEEARKTQD